MKISLLASLTTVAAAKTYYQGHGFTMSEVGRPEHQPVFGGAAGILKDSLAVNMDRHGL